MVRRQDHRVPCTCRDIGVIIPTLNESAHIASTIQSTLGAGQVIVVDGGSSDQTVSIAGAFSRVQVVHAPLGRGTQLAAGADVCDREIFLFLHADCQLPQDALTDVVEAINAGEIWGAFHQRISARGIGYRLLERGNALRVRCFGIPFGDQAIFTRRDAYQAAGGFERVPLMEDVRLSRRLRAIAWPLLLKRSVTLDARRWQRRGILGQTWLNWRVQFLHRMGVPVERLAEIYRSRRE
jgi:rSAM/selenodomain-associated transferase 2